MNNLLFGLLVFVTGFPAIAHARLYLGDPSTSCIIAKSVNELPYEIKSTKDRQALKDVIEKRNFDCGGVSFAIGRKTTIGRVITVGRVWGHPLAGPWSIGNVAPRTIFLDRF